jgi:hypothetical protein
VSAVLGKFEEIRRNGSRRRKGKLRAKAPSTQGKRRKTALRLGPFLAVFLCAFAALRASSINVPIRAKEFDYSHRDG